MQHDVVDSVLAAFSRQWIGRASPTVAGLSVVPLLGWDKPDAARLWRSPAARASDARGLSPAREVAPVVWSEAAPPHPRRLRARNLEGTVVVVDVGTVLDGGMSTRSVGATVVLPPRTWMTVAVEPVGARWWDEGPMRRAGRL